MTRGSVPSGIPSESVSKFVILKGRTEGSKLGHLETHFPATPSPTIWLSSRTWGSRKRGSPSVFVSS